MIADPLSEPAVKYTDADKLPGSTAVTVAALGTAAGVTGTAVDAVPSPIELTARILTEYEVPFTNFVMEIGLSRDMGYRAVHVVPLLVEYL